MKNIPNRMWLVLGLDQLSEEELAEVDFDKLNEVSWCNMSLHDHDVEYVRVEHVSKLAETLKGLFTLADGEDNRYKSGYVQAMNDIIESLNK